MKLTLITNISAERRLGWFHGGREVLKHARNGVAQAALYADLVADGGHGSRISFHQVIANHLTGVMCVLFDTHLANGSQARSSVPLRPRSYAERTYLLGRGAMRPGLRLGQA